MDLWHYLGLFAFGSIVTLAGVVRRSVRREWWWIPAALVPIAAAGAWIGVVWINSDWESSFFDQEPWILTAELGLLALVWATAVATWWASTTRKPSRRAPRGTA